MMMRISLNKKEDKKLTKESVLNPLSFSLLNGYHEDLTIEDLIDKVENITRTVFPNDSVKQVVENHNNRITFSCPYCGDSEKNSRKKRGNIFLQNKWFKCFNCFQSMPSYKFFQDFKEESNISDIELLLLKNTSDDFQDKRRVGIDILESELINKYSLDKKFIEKKLDYQPINDSNIKEYLNNRLQRKFQKFSYDPNYNAVVIYNISEDYKVIGLIFRMLGKSRNKYLSYKLSNIYNDLGLNYDKEEMNKIESISNLFNILQINFNKKITVFEGPFDAYLYKNSLALSGLSKNMPFEIENICFWFDNDMDGKKKTKNMLENGHSVFLWKKYFEDMNIENVRIKDLTDLYIHCRKTNKKIIKFEDYFSNNKYDLYWL